MKEMIIVVLSCLIILQLAQKLRKWRRRTTPERNLLKWFSIIYDKYDDKRLQAQLSKLSQTQLQSIKEFLILQQKTIDQEIEKESDKHHYGWIARKEDNLYRTKKVLDYVNSLLN